MLVLSGQDAPATHPHEVTLTVRNGKWCAEEEWRNEDSP
jgi:hypothetical protein